MAETAWFVRRLARILPDGRLLSSNPQFYIHNSKFSIVVYIIPNLPGMFNDNRTFLGKNVENRSKE